MVLAPSRSHRHRFLGRAVRLLEDLGAVQEHVDGGDALARADLRRDEARLVGDARPVLGMTELHRERHDPIKEDGADILLGHVVGVGRRDDNGVLAFPKLEGKVHRERLRQRPFLQPRDLHTIEHHEHASHALGARGETGQSDTLLIDMSLVPGRGDHDLER